MTRQEAWTFYRSCLLPSITYPLTSSHFLEKQLDKVQKKAMTIIYAKCGFNRHKKREVLCGPLDLGGAGFRRLFIKQGIALTRYFLRHWRMQSIIGKLLKCSLSWIQLSHSVSYSLPDRVHVTLPHLESRWFASLRQFLATVDASIQLDDPEVSPIQREGDEYIMDIIRQTKLLEMQRFENSSIVDFTYKW